MPRGDRTGPRGQGPRTGRGLGYCAGYDGPGCAEGRRRSFGRGQARTEPMQGRRRRRLPLRAPSQEEEVEALKEEKKELEKEMEDIDKRLEELEEE